VSLQAADGFDHLVALLEAALSDTLGKRPEGLGQLAAFAATHRPFLLTPWLAACQQIADVLPLQPLDRHLWIVW
jgi:hypothetical protein